MSAFIVSEEHVNALVELALVGPSDNRNSRGPVGNAHWNSLSYYTRDPQEVFEESSRDEYWQALSDAHVEVGKPGGSPDSVGAMLMRACVASVGYRYQDTLWPELPGPMPNPDPDEFSYRPTFTGRRPTAVEGLKLIGCFEYQSCEHPDWKGSEAQRFCESLRDSLIGALDGYDDAPWEWSRGAPVSS
jgi:hypothetical protein